MAKVLVRIIIAVLLGLLAGKALADATGYDVLTTAPVQGMLPIGTTFTLPVLNIGTGQMEGRQATIEAYVRWNQPVRPPEYYVVLRDATCGAYCPWFILNRETINAAGA